MGRSKKTKKPESIQRRALRVEQNIEHPIYVFSLAASEIFKVADISRIARDEAGKLIGYQRPQVKRHIEDIVTYLNAEGAIFPNSLILALGSDTVFTRSRGPGGFDGYASAGKIEIPIPLDGEPRPGWLVDGQQRAFALSEIDDQEFPVLVTAFIADEIAVQREQFLRVNNIKPLPRGLVTELLPDVDSPLPARLAASKIPSALCDLLNREEESPFFGLIRRASSSKEEAKRAVITDTSVIKMLKGSLTSSAGCLFPYRNIVTNETDFDGVWAVLTLFWDQVKETFPEAWDKPPRQSRLMHGAGIRAMGRLMDRMMAVMDPTLERTVEIIAEDLAELAPHCHWTSGRWDELGGLAWNEIQNTPKHIRMLSSHLIRVYTRIQRAKT